MKEHPKDPHGSHHASHFPRAATSPLRLIVLLSLLTVFGGALLYDWVIAPPRVKAAYDNLNDTVRAYNEFGLAPESEKSADGKGGPVVGNKGGLLYRQDIQNILGMSPTKVEKFERYTIEHYCWWGRIPRKSNFITVLYIGSPDKPHYSTHYANEMPEDEVIPGKKKFDQQPVVDVTGAGEVATAGAGAGPPPGMMPPGMGGPGMGAAGGGKSKGRPESKPGKAAELTKAGATQVETKEAAKETK